jgi:hypothetical protein
VQANTCICDIADAILNLAFPESGAITFQPKQNLPQLTVQRRQAQASLFLKRDNSRRKLTDCID